MAPTGKTPWTAVATVCIAAATGAVAMGMFPKCSDLQTKAEAAQIHMDMRHEFSVEAKNLGSKIDELKTEIRKEREQNGQLLRQLIDDLRKKGHTK